MIHLRNGDYGLVEIKHGGDKLIEIGSETLKDLASIIDIKNMSSPSFMMVLCAKASFAYKRDDDVKVFGAALDFAISAGIVALGYGGIRTLISHLGKKQAERLVRSVVIDKVRSALFKYGFSSAASWITDGAVGIIISGILEPGAAIARWVDSRDKISNNGYIELW